MLTDAQARQTSAHKAGQIVEAAGLSPRQVIARTVRICPQVRDESALRAPAREVSLRQAVRRWGRPGLLLVGEPGMGKTIAVAALARELAEADPAGEGSHSCPVPILIRAAEVMMGEGGPDAPARLLAAMRKAVGADENGMEPANGFERWLRQGHRLLILDGLNEVPYPQRRSLAASATDLTQQCQRLRLLLTSRKLGDAASLRLQEAGFTCAQVAELSDRQVQQLAETTLTPERAREFVKLVKQGGTPALRSPEVTLAALVVFDEPDGRPVNEVTLLDRLVRRALSQADPGMSFASAQPQLVDLAWQMQLGCNYLEMPLAPPGASPRRTRSPSQWTEEEWVDLLVNARILERREEAGRAFVNFRRQSHQELYAAHRVAELWGSQRKRPLRKLLPNAEHREVLARAAGWIEADRGDWRRYFDCLMGWGYEGIAGRALANVSESEAGELLPSVVDRIVERAKGTLKTMPTADWWALVGVVGLWFVGALVMAQKLQGGISVTRWGPLPVSDIAVWTVVAYAAAPALVLIWSRLALRAMRLWLVEARWSEFVDALHYIGDEWWRKRKQELYHLLLTSRNLYPGLGTLWGQMEHIVQVRDQATSEPSPVDIEHFMKCARDGDRAALGMVDRVGRLLSDTHVRDLLELLTNTRIEVRDLAGVLLAMLVRLSAELRPTIEPVLKSRIRSLSSGVQKQVWRIIRPRQGIFLRVGEAVRVLLRWIMGRGGNGRGGEPRSPGQTDVPDASVFISGSGDYPEEALKAYRFLKAQGIEPFFFTLSLPPMLTRGSPGFLDAIGRAIKQCRHMVVVMNEDALRSLFVAHEWGMFLAAILDGSKAGIIVTLTVEPVWLGDLDPNLRMYPAMPFSEQALSDLPPYLR